MNWLDDYVRPTLKTFGVQTEVPDNLWTQCPSCQKMMFKKQLEEALYVCQHCQHHLKMPLRNRLDSLFDDGAFELLPQPAVAADPLKFKAKKAYATQFKENQRRSGEEEAILVAKGEMGGHRVVVAAFNSEFMGGSMGTAVGEAFVRAAQKAANSGAAFIALTTSGGARMQEGALSLMQMPRTTIGVQMVREAGLPFRDAHHVTGSLVALAEREGKDLPDLTLDQMKSAHSAITEDVFTVLGVDNSVASRTSYGGTAPDQVRAQIARWKEVLA